MPTKSIAESDAARIEPVPAEPQQQSAGSRDRQIMRHHRAAAVALELASEPRSQHDRAGQRDHAADRMHDRRARKVMEALPRFGRKYPAAPMLARKPSGPHAQWPMIG